MTGVVPQAAEFWNELWRNARWADLLDVLTIFVLLSLTAHWLWRRASRAVIVALSIVLGLYVVAHLLRMYLTLLLFQVGVTVIVVALILLFRHDLRRAFERLAAWRLERPSQRSAVRQRIIDTLAEAVTLLANEKIGALIVIPGREPVEHHIRGGVPLEGRMSVPLFHSIFHPESSGHDGAALVEGEHVEAFGVHLPLSRNLEEVGRAGTRHTAALGLAERCDAFVVVVSEERGTISIAERGRLTEVESPAEFSDRLRQFYQHLYPRRRERVRQWVRPYSLAINVGSLAAAMLLWYFLAFRVETVQRSFEAVPIEFRNLPKDWIIAESQPSRVTLTLAGPQRAFDHLEREQLLVSFDLGRIRPGRQTFVIDESAVTMPADVELEQVDQETVRVTAYPGRRVEL
ncbi:MAG: diadenylate cyclase, partial [Planctomycetaceae bacterium]